jgi:polyisoprenyl-phosphate glycosyltransferase
MSSSPPAMIPRRNALRPGPEPRVIPAGVRPLLAILCPVYNEEKVVPLFMARLLPVIRRLETVCEVQLVFLNNASEDGTLDLILEPRPDWPRTYVLSMSRNVGYQGSIETGLRAVDADLYAFIDVDCEDPPELLPVFVHRWREGYDVVYGQRADRDEPRLIKACRRIFYRVLQKVADEDIVLDMAEFSLFTREVRDAVLRENTSFPFLRGAIARVGFRRVGLEYKRDKRIGGQTHYNVLGMSVFAIAGILASSTLLLRLPAFMLPAWFLALCACTIAYCITGALWIAATGFLLTAGYLGFGVAAVALYVARAYKNGLMRPNAVLDSRSSRPPPGRTLG